MEMLVAMVAFAILVEGTIEYIKLGIQKKICAEIIGAFVFAVVVCLAYGFDLFAVLGVQAKIPYIGSIMTALVISRGSNYFFDFIGKLTEAEELLTAEQKLNMAIERDDEPNEDTVSHEIEDGRG